MGYIYHEGNTNCLLVGTTRGRLVIWQKPGSGDKFAPYKDPTNNLSLVRFCSDWDYYAAAPGYPQTFSITHTAQSADPGTTYTVGSSSYTAYNQVNTTIITVATHNLGYVPRIMAMVNGIQYPAGCPVHVYAKSGRRMICFYADTTNLYIKEQARPSISGLAAIGLTYYVCLFRPNSQVAGAPLYYASGSRVRLGYGSLDTEETSLREPAAGEPTFGIPSGSMMDLHNGRFRWALPDGSVFDLGPAIGPTSYNNAFYGGSPVKQVSI
jgi:hypothetical protein